MLQIADLHVHLIRGFDEEFQALLQSDDLNGLIIASHGHFYALKKHEGQWLKMNQGGKAIENIGNVYDFLISANAKSVADRVQFEIIAIRGTSTIPAEDATIASNKAVVRPLIELIGKTNKQVQKMWSVIITEQLHLYENQFLTYAWTRINFSLMFELESISFS